MRPIIIFIAFIFFTVLGQAQSNISDSQRRAIGKFERVMSLVQANYMDTVDFEQLIETAMVKVLEELDPHSVYLDPAASLEARNSLNGGFNGVGISYRMIDDTITIVSTVKGGPSEKAGVNRGDQVIWIAGEKTANVKIKSTRIRDLLRGKPGTSVQLVVRRYNESDSLPLLVYRGYIPSPPLKDARMIDDEIGYIKLAKFGASAHRAFADSLKSLKKQGMKDLILDLRNNTGGYLKQAVNIANEFLGNDQLIVYTYGENSDTSNYKATRKGKFKKGKLVVLINKYSASASEIVAGAIQDHDRGVIIGERSFGKGLVQRPFSLYDGSYLRLSIARYYTPSGRCIQKDYQHDSDEYKKRVSLRTMEFEKQLRDSLFALKSHNYYTLNSQRPVFEAGGIFPDIYAPGIENSLPQLYQHLYNELILVNTVVKYLHTRRNFMLVQYPDFEKFNSEFKIPEDFYSFLKQYAFEKGVDPADGFEPENQVQEIVITKFMKSIFTYYLFTEKDVITEFILNSSEMAAARKSLNNKNSYESILADGVVK